MPAAKVSWDSSLLTLGHFVPTNYEHLQYMLLAHRITENDVVLDIGSGDGRFLQGVASLTGCRGIGVEVNPELHFKALDLCAEAIKEGQLLFINMAAERLRISGGYVDWNDTSEKVTVVYLYQLNVAKSPVLIKMLRELLELGVHIVTNTFSLPREVEAHEEAAWPPDVDTADGMVEHLSRVGAHPSTGHFHVYRKATPSELRALDQELREEQQLQQLKERRNKQMQSLIEEYKTMEKLEQETRIALEEMHKCEQRIDEDLRAMEARHEKEKAGLLQGAETSRRLLGCIEAELTLKMEETAAKRMEKTIEFHMEVKREHNWVDFEIEEKRKTILTQIEAWRRQNKREFTLLLEEMDAAAAEVAAYRARGQLEELWECLNCTWANTSSRPKCIMCDSRRGMGLIDWAHSDTPWEARNGDSKRAPVEVEEASQAEFAQGIQRQRRHREEEEEARRADAERVRTELQSARHVALRCLEVKLRDKARQMESDLQLLDVDVWALQWYHMVHQATVCLQRRALKGKHLQERASMLLRKRLLVEKQERVDELDRERGAASQRLHRILEEEPDGMLNDLWSVELERRRAKSQRKAIRNQHVPQLCHQVSSQPARLLN